MKKLAVALVALMSLTTAVEAQTPKDLLAALLVKWNKPTEPFKMIGNVYYVGTDGLASYLITSPQGHILVDTVMPEATSQIKASIEKLGFKVTDIKYLLNTHAHIDHTGGLAEMKQASGAQLVAGEADKSLLEGGYYPGAEEDTALEFPPVKVDRTVREGDTVTVGDVTLTARETPGHSPGCTSWAFSVKDGDATRSVLIFCSGTVALNRLVRQPDLSRDRRRLPEDVRAGQGHEGGRAARAASGNVQDGRRSAPSSPMARPIRSSIPASSTPMPRRWKRRSKTRSPSRPPPRRKRRAEPAREGARGLIRPARLACSHTARRSTGSRP